MPNFRLYTHQASIDDEQLGLITQQRVTGAPYTRSPAGPAGMSADPDYLAQLQRALEPVLKTPVRKLLRGSSSS
jgi:hypothetical protein